MTKIQKTFLALFVLFLAAVPVWKYLAVPELLKLPTDYALHLNLLGQNIDFDDNGNALPEYIVNVQRTDAVTETEPDHLIIESTYSVKKLDGSIVFENKGRYKVNRNTRQNSGTVDGTTRTGQFLFPPKAQKNSYELWNANFGDKGVATFSKEDNVEGLPVFLYDFVVSDINENEGFGFIDGIPEKYNAITSGTASIYVEPITGTIVNYEERGASRLYDKAGTEMNPIAQWSNKFSTDTIANQVRIAQNAKQTIQLYERWIPILLGLVSLAFLIALFASRKVALKGDDQNS